MSIRGQKNELYGNYMLEVLDYCFAIFDLSGCLVLMLDGDFGWHRKCSYAICLVFKSMGSHTIGVSTWSDGWEMIKNHEMIL